MSLNVSNLTVHHGAICAVNQVSLAVPTGKLAAIIGSNGAGKTTLLRALSGLNKPTHGVVNWMGETITGTRPEKLVRMGISHVSEGKSVIPELTVKENLELGVIAQKNRGDMSALVDEIAETFPRLKERLGQDGTSMSGGEQQMLAIARAMIAKPKVILLDEPSEGIMPVLVDEMFELFAKLKQQGLTILLVEQNVQQALKISDRAYILDQGEIVFHDTAQNLLNNDDIQQKYCAV